jgi:hypothetical protein
MRRFMSQAVIRIQEDSLLIKPPHVVRTARHSDVNCIHKFATY